MNSHEIWAAAQLIPGEGIEDGVDRIEALLPKHAFTEQELADLISTEIAKAVEPLGRWLHSAYDRPPQTPEMKAMLAYVDKLVAQGQP